MELLRPKDLAELWKCGQRHIYYLIADGELPAIDIKRPGSKRSRWRITHEDAEAYARRKALPKVTRNEPRGDTS